MAHGIPLLEEGWEGGHGLCPSDLEKWRLAVMATPIPLPEGRREGSHGICSSDLESRRSVVMVIPYHFQSEGGKAAMFSCIFLLGSGGVLSKISMGMGMV